MHKLNEDIALFPQVHPITEDMTRTFEGVSRLVMLDRYAFKDTELKTLDVGDTVVLTAKEDPQFPARAVGVITSIYGGKASIELEPEFHGLTEDGSGFLRKDINALDKPLELFYEQIAKRVSTGLSAIENPDIREKIRGEFEDVLESLDFVPAGRVLYGAGSGAEVTYFNCYVMPFPKDSREGINEHRGETMGIMSRGGGVGTNGSTLRPRNALARGVNGKSSGAVSWLNDIAQLTNLVQQGGSRRGAQMIMLADWHPDIFEFIISKMQNPKILRFIAETTEDEVIRKLAQDKLKFKPFTQNERYMLESFVEQEATSEELDDAIEEAKQKLADGGTYSVHDPEFLSGANISVAITHEFMEAVENDGDYELRFPDVDTYSQEDMRIYNETWHEVGDVREWHLPVKTYRTVKAKELWNLINICATYAAEPGVFFIDNANDDTNAAAYGQKVVATNPCGEQPLAPYSVCNLAAVNLANMVTADGTLDVARLKRTVKVGVRMQDNVIDSTPYFLEKNEEQAKGERRIGLGVMGLADLLIKMKVAYGSPEGNEVVDEVFRIISHEAYRASVDLAAEKGSFPFLAEMEEENSMAARLNFVTTGYMKRMPFEIKAEILAHGIRNSHLLTVAPTGSTGTMVGVSTGLEPYFSFKYYRSGRLGKFIEVNAAIVTDVLGEGFEGDLPDYFVSSMDLSPEAHVDVQTTIQRHVDSSLSKTVNAPRGYSVEQVQSVYSRLHKGGAKGGTVYVDGSRDAQVLTLTNDDSPQEEREKPRQVIVDTIPPLEGTSSGKNVGVDIGDTCPVCTVGTVEDLGGCATCTNCNAQLKCGL